jgi:hypothetical protein
MLVQLILCGSLNLYIDPPPVQPFPSWIIQEGTNMWKPPSPMPDDGKNYIWNEPTVSWVEVQL